MTIVGFKEVPIEKIKTLDKLNIRQGPIKDDLYETMTTIKHDGLLTPVQVKETKKGSGEYILIYGHRRLSAVKKLGHKTIWASLRDPEEDLTEEKFLVLNTIENIHRKQISEIEFGRVCDKMRKDMSNNEIAARFSVSTSRVKNSIELYRRVPDKYRKKIYQLSGRNKRKGRIGATISNAIMRLRNVTKKEREMLFDLARKEEMTSMQMDLLNVLLKEGMTFDESIEGMNKYKVVDMRIPVNIEIFEGMEDFSGDFSKSFSRYVRRLLLEVNKNLIFVKKSLRK